VNDETSHNLPQNDGFREAELGSEMNVAKVHGSILRERAEPQDGYEPIPLWLITFFFSVIFAAGLYLAYNSGGFRSDVYNASLVSWTGGGSTAPVGPPDPMVLGRRLYTANCVACHQTTGLGVAGQFPTLVGSEWVVSAEWHGENHLVKVLLHGLQGVVQVKGNTYNGAMPPWSQLKDDQIASILTYIRNEWGNSAPPITADFVKTIREQNVARTEPWSQKELQAIPALKIPAGGIPPDAPATPAAAPAPAA